MKKQIIIGLMAICLMSNVFAFTQQQIDVQDFDTVDLNYAWDKCYKGNNGVIYCNIQFDYLKKTFNETNPYASIRQSYPIPVEKTAFWDWCIANKERSICVSYMELRRSYNFYVSNTDSLIRNKLKQFQSNYDDGLIEVDISSFE